VQVNTAWRCGFRPIDETGIVLALAHEHGVPVLFVSGDDVLARSVGASAPFLLTKRALSVRMARSFPTEIVDLSLARAASAQPRPAPEAPRGPIAVQLKFSGRVYQARGGSFRERYREAFRICEESGAELEGRVLGEPGTPEFAQSAAALF
jgi:D-amino peptidase